MMRRFVLLAIGLVALLGADRWLKSLALAGRTVDWPLWRFMLVENHGAVFSWAVPNRLAAAIMLGAMLGLVWYGWKQWRQRKIGRLVGVLLMFSGAASNAYDRLAHGFVIDWAYLGPWWPVFNLADVMIGVGVLLLLWPKRKRLTVS